MATISNANAISPLAEGAPGVPKPSIDVRKALLRLTADKDGVM